MRISENSRPVLICTEATLAIAMLSSVLPIQRGLIRATRSALTSMRVGKIRFPFVQRLAENDSVMAPPSWTLSAVPQSCEAAWSPPPVHLRARQATESVPHSPPEAQLEQPTAPDQRARLLDSKPSENRAP